MTKQIRIDPRIFISPPYRNCPKCDRDDFGALHIGPHLLTRRCRECWHTQSETLPELSKKVVYLDQMVFSNMTKTLDPVWAAQKEKQDPYWSAAFDALERASKLQLIVCPWSTIHEKETALSPQPGMIRALYEHMAQGVQFEYPTIILGHQLGAGFRAVLDGREPDYGSIPRHMVVRGDPDRWVERIRISVNLGDFGPAPDERREIRARSHEAFAKIFEQWCREKDKHFDDWYDKERRGHAETILILYQERLELLSRFARGEVPFSEDVWNPRLEAEILPGLVAIAEESGLTANESFQAAIDFLNSPQGQNAPANDISALLMAALARKAASGQKRPPSQGMWNDITAISSFLPYCDAMFVDDECAGFLREEPLRTRIRTGCRVFSNNSREAFLEYLRDLESEAGLEHVDLVSYVYGEDWATPYRSVLEREREREREADKR